MSHSHSHSHDNIADHGHSHEILDGPGSYINREQPLYEGRDWRDRAFTIGIGGYVLKISLKPKPKPKLTGTAPSGQERQPSC